MSLKDKHALLPGPVGCLVYTPHETKNSGSFPAVQWAAASI